MRLIDNKDDLRSCLFFAQEKITLLSHNSKSCVVFSPKLNDYYLLYWEVARANWKVDGDRSASFSTHLVRGHNNIMCMNRIW